MRRPTDAELSELPLKLEGRVTRWLRKTALVASTLQLLTRPTHPEPIVGTAEEATAFVQGLLAKASKPGESSPTQDELLVAYEQVTRQVWQTR